jgi:hypothetical protein
MSTTWVPPGQTPTDPKTGEAVPRVLRPASERVDRGSDIDGLERRGQQKERTKWPQISRKTATTAFIWSGVVQAYEVTSNMLPLPGWVWGVAGFVVTLPEMVARGRDAYKSWRGRR